MKPIRCYGIGNALVDVIEVATDAFLSANDIEKGIMQLVDSERALALYGKMATPVRVAGGSAANTIASLAMLGHNEHVQYVSKVCDDELGDFFAKDMGALGVIFNTPRDEATETMATGRCMIFVSEDGERSMNTYLGASEFLRADDIDYDNLHKCEWLYLEGYRFDGPDSQTAFQRAVDETKLTGGKTSITLSDPFCVERHRRAFRALIDRGVDLVFCNEAELKSFYEVKTRDEAIIRAKMESASFVMTASGDGAFVVEDNDVTHVPTTPKKVVDATGAGDSFAAGYLHGKLLGRSSAVCAKIGSRFAGEVISHYGTRPESDLKTLIADL